MKWDMVWYVFLFVIFLIWIFIPSTPDPNEIFGESNPDHMFFSNKYISYSFTRENPCYGIKADRIHNAFGIIQEETEWEIFFEYESIGEGDIIINCYNEDSLLGGIAGLGGPIFYEGEREILGGEIDFYPYLEDEIFCQSYPTTELHEILHVLGFDHFFDEESIMYLGLEEIELYEWEDDQPYVCQEIDYEIVECLKNIYSNGANGSSCGNLKSICFARLCPPEFDFTFTEPE